MKRFLLTVAAAAVIASPQMANAQVNSPDAAGYIERGRLMFDDANYRGCVDQMGHALKLNVSENERENARFFYALAAMALPEMDALPLWEKFIEDYPASPRLSQALLNRADCFYDRNEWANALAAYELVEPSCLNPQESELCRYRTAYCLLKLGEYDRAEAIYTNLQSSPLANEARFYSAYIAYVRHDYNRAAELFRSVNPADAPCDMTPYYLSQIYFLKKDYRQALNQAKALLANNSVDPEFKAETERVAGESLYALSDEKGALSYIRRYVSSTSNPLPSSLYILGVEDYRDGKYEQAIERLTPVTAELSSIGQSAYLYIGQAYLKLDNYNAATMALEKAARMEEDMAVQETAMYNLAVAQMQGGRIPFGSSVSRFEEFLQRYPDSKFAPEVEDYIINGYMTDNNPAAALRAINNIKNPSDKVLAAKQQVLYLLGSRELQGGSTAQALTHLTEAARMSRFNSELAGECNLWIGECLYRQGKYSEAVGSYNSFIRSAEKGNSNLALAYYDLGYARFALKQFANAKTDFQKAIDIAKGRKTPISAEAIMADAYNRLADSYYYSSDFKSAAANYERAYSCNPKAGDYPMYQQGLMKGLQRDHDSKIEILSEMTSKFPTSSLVPSALLEIGQSYGELGKDGRAIETYTALAARYPNSAQGRQGSLLLAMTYLNSGNRAQAISQYKKVISNYPTSDEARVASDDLKHLMADEGRLGEYVRFIDNVPNSPKVETAELAALSLESTEKALEAGHTDAAYARAVEIVETYPDSPQVVRALAIKADIEAAQGKAEPALASYRELEERASSSSDINNARMGILRVSRDLGNHQLVIETADRILESSSTGSSLKSEAAYLKAASLAADNRGDEAIEIWTKLAEDTDDIYGTKSAFDIALYNFENGRTDDALTAVNKLIDANPPHDYWLARAFILLSDIQRKQGKEFEANEYLRSLKENYPGSEADIFQMIDSRLK